MPRRFRWRHDAAAAAAAVAYFMRLADGRAATLIAIRRRFDA